MADSADFEILKRVVLHDQQVDLVHLGPFMVFMFMDDASYQGLDTSVRRKSVADLERHVLNPSVVYEGPRAYIPRWQALRDGVMDLVTATYSTEADACFLDIGCQYGTSAMETALFLRSIGKRIPIFAFDCGLAGLLAPMNIVNNRFEDEIAFHSVAVGSVNKYVLVHRDLGFSADNRIVNGAFLWERGSLSFPMKCITLDAFFEAKGLNGPFVAKIDTQGAEPEVLAGASAVLSRGRHALVLEYTPDAVQPRIDAVTFLQDILQSNDVFDLGASRSSIEHVAAETATTFAERVRSSKEKWTDLLVLSKGYWLNAKIRERLPLGQNA